MKNRNLTGGLFDGCGKPQPLKESAKSKQTVIPEKIIQASFIYWRDLHKTQYPILNCIFSVPNGLWAQNVAVAKANVRQGLTKGIQDVICLSPSADKKYPGLLIEFKTEDLKNSVQSDEQLYFHDFFANLGYLIVVLRCWEDASDLVIDYLLPIRKSFRRH